MSKLFVSVVGLLYELRTGKLSQLDIELGLFYLPCTKEQAHRQNAESRGMLKGILKSAEEENRVRYSPDPSIADMNSFLESLGFTGIPLGTSLHNMLELKHQVQLTKQELELVV